MFCPPKKISVSYFQFFLFALTLKTSVRAQPYTRPLRVYCMARIQVNIRRTRVRTKTTCIQKTQCGKAQ